MSSTSDYCDEEKGDYGNSAEDDAAEVEDDLASSLRSRIISAQLLDCKVTNEIDVSESLIAEELLAMSAASNPLEKLESGLRSDLQEMDSVIESVRSWRTRSASRKALEESDQLLLAEEAGNEEDAIDAFVRNVCEAVPEDSLEFLSDQLSREGDASASSKDEWAIAQYKSIEKQLALSDKAIDSLRSAMKQTAKSTSSVSSKTQLHETKAGSAMEFADAICPSKSIFSEIEEHIKEMELQYIEAATRAKTKYQIDGSTREQTIIEEGIAMQTNVSDLQDQLASFEKDLEMLLDRK